MAAVSCSVDVKRIWFGAAAIAFASCAPYHDQTLASVASILEAHGTTVPKIEEPAPIPQDPIDAHKAVEIALSRNREVRAALEELGVAEADLYGARLPPNPVASGALLFPAQSGEQGSGTKIEGGLGIDLVRLLIFSPRVRAAESKLEVAKLRAAERIRLHALEVERTYYAAAAAEEALEAQKMVADAADAASAFAARQREAGNTSELEASHHAMASKEARLELARIEIERLEALHRLARLMGVSSQAAKLRVALPLPPLPAAEVPLDGLIASAMRDRIDIQAAAQEIEAAERASTAAAWGRVPEIRGGAALEREIDGHLIIGPSLQVGLPIFDRNQAEIARAEARIRVAREQQQALADAAAAEVGSASARVSAARRAVEYYRDEVLPLMGRIVSLSQRQYNQMQLGVFELLRAKKSETEARRQSIEALRDYWRARVDLAQAVGR